MEWHWWALVWAAGAGVTFGYEAGSADKKDRAGGDGCLILVLCLVGWPVFLPASVAEDVVGWLKGTKR